MKKAFNIILVLFVIMVGFSCSKTKSYTDRLKDQEKAISRFIDRNNIVLLREYPKDHKFAENEFVYINGVYLNVIKPGNGDSATLYETKVLYRAKGEFIDPEVDTTYVFDIFSVFNSYTNGKPGEFTYGTFSLSGNSSDDTYYFLSEGLGVPLSLLKDSCEVKMIVPFQMGSSVAQSSYMPMYYERVRYIFDK